MFKGLPPLDTCPFPPLIHPITSLHIEKPFRKGLVRNYVQQNNLARTKLEKWPSLAELRGLSSRHIVSHFATNSYDHCLFRPNIK